MFDIHFRRWWNTPEDRQIMARDLPTLEAAREARGASGDLVVHAGTDNIVDSEEWLWDWEKESPISYAKKAIKFGIPKPEED